MDGQGNRCARCGASLNAGRFCANCGAPLGSALAPPLSEPAHDDTATRERMYAVPDRPAYSAPSRDEAGSGPPAHGEPPRSPGAGLWIGAAAGLVLVLVLGAFLLVRGGRNESPSTSPPPLLPKPPHTPPAPPPPSPPTKPPPTAAARPSPSAPTSAPTTAPAAAPSGPPGDVAGLTSASAPSHAPQGVDLAGRPVTFVAPNMVDGVADTSWRTPGDATGMV